MPDSVSILELRPTERATSCPTRRTRLMLYGLFLACDTVHLTPPSSPHRARTRPQARSQMGLSNLQIPTEGVTIHFTATYAAVRLCRGNGHDEVVAVRCVCDSLQGTGQGRSTPTLCFFVATCRKRRRPAAHRPRRGHLRRRTAWRCRSCCRTRTCRTTRRCW
jgi:hypothetical protein